jgi:tetratricopeptide (TPR) repeat protein
MSSPIRSGAFVHPLLRARDWQDRPEFGELLQWWKDGGVGVCALVGIGGAGKTAIAERFLQVLPSGYPEHPKVPKDRSLAAPARLLVFSFYDAPNPDTFFNELVAWLQGRSPGSSDDLTQLPSYQQTLERLAAVGRCLLMLDGLEKVQDDGSRGGAFGQILDGRLRDFVLRATDGWLPQVSLVITSRFRLYDPLATRSWYYRQIPIEKLDSPAAVKLLRDRGVRGTDDELEQVAENQGFHALSVDLTGGYIANFCEGDPQRFSSLSLTGAEKVDVSSPALDPRLAAVREQERRFAHLAEQYHQALAKSDAAALALLQRVCLFRLGVEAKTLASIFTGKGKTKVSGQALARLSERQLKAKLQLLAEMRLAEVSKSQSPAQKSPMYTVHPAVRDGFLKRMDAEAARLGHDAAREGLELSLGGQSGGFPSDVATLDLLEEIAYHTLAAEHPQEAFDIYQNRIGGYRNLLWRLGAYERGERICRVFAAGDSPQSAPFPVGLSEDCQEFLINDWGLYLRELGRLVAASHCFERSINWAMRQENYSNGSAANRVLADTLLLAGRLTAGLHAAQEALQLAKRVAWARQSALSNIYYAYACLLRGEIVTALAGFRDALEFHQKDHAEQDVIPGPSYMGRSFLLIGRAHEAERTAYEIKKICEAQWTDGNPFSPQCNLTLADLAQEKGDLFAAREWLREAHEWALQRDAKELLCWSALVEAKIELSLFNSRHPPDQVNARVILSRSAAALETGFRIARECGYGLYHIDLLLVRAQLVLHEGRAADAEQDVRVALDEGVHPPAESGFPELLAATDPECLYAWGIAEGRHLLGEALLLQAAQKLGEVEFVPKRLDRLPADVRELIGRAREQLDQALELWCKLRDPESDAEINPRGERTKRVLEGLAGGILTEYPLVAIAGPAQTSTPQATPQESTVAKPAVASVFVCYAQADNKPPGRWLDRLREILSPLVLQENLAVWSDQELKIGEEWDPEIQKQLGAAKVVVLLVSPAFLASKYIANSELPVLLRRRSEDGLAILPVLLSPSLYDKTRFKWPDPKTGPEEFTLSSFQAAGSPKKTLSEMTGPQRNRAFVALAERILEIVGASP